MIREFPTIQTFGIDSFLVDIHRLQPDVESWVSCEPVDTRLMNSNPEHLNQTRDHELKSPRPACKWSFNRSCLDTPSEPIPNPSNLLQFSRLGVRIFRPQTSVNQKIEVPGTLIKKGERKKKKTIGKKSLSIRSKSKNELCTFSMLKIAGLRFRLCWNWLTQVHHYKDSQGHRFQHRDNT